MIRDARWFHAALALDRMLLLRVRAWERPWATWFMRWFTRIGDVWTWLGLGIVLALSGRAAREAALLLLLAVSGSRLAAEILKRVCARRRPSLAIPGFHALMENPDAGSFPSGHASAAFGCATALLSAGSPWGWVALGAASLIASSRVYLGAHYPLDVVAGALLGCASGIAAQLVLR